MSRRGQLTFQFTSKGLQILRTGELLAVWEWSYGEVLWIILGKVGYDLVGLAALRLYVDERESRWISTCTVKSEMRHL